MNDIHLRQSILDEMEFEPSIDAAGIGVAVHSGIVTLTGHVRTYAEKEAAERVVSRVKGVRGIAADIEVQIFGPKETDDDDIARRAVKMLDWNVSVPKDSVQVRVLKGWITLRGRVSGNIRRTQPTTACAISPAWWGYPTSWSSSRVSRPWTSRNA